MRDNPQLFDYHFHVKGLADKFIDFFWYGHRGFYLPTYENYMHAPVLTLFPYFFTQLKTVHSGHVEVNQCCAIRNSAQEIEGCWAIHGRIKTKTFFFEIKSEYSGKYRIVIYD